MIVATVNELMRAFIMVGIGFIAMWELLKFIFMRTIGAFGYDSFKTWFNDMKKFYFRNENMQK